MWKKQRVLCWALSLSFVLLGCKRSSNRKNGANDKIYVVATTGMIADITRKIGGSYIRVEGLMGPSVDPHLYKATASDTHKLTHAKLILYNGLHLEGKMQGVLKKVGKFRSVVAVSDQMDHSKLLRPKAFKGFHDPHIWFDVHLWKQASLRVALALIKIDPAHKKQYEHRAKKYVKKLDALHAWVKRSMLLIPKGQRYLITSHDAFGYFGRAYGLKVVGLQGISTVAEAGIKDVERVIKLLVEKKIPAIFSETSVSDKMIRAVIQGCTARKHTVKIGGRLYSDAMGTKGTSEGTYVGMVQANVHKIVKALSGKKAPAFVAPKEPVKKRTPRPKKPVKQSTTKTRKKAKGK